jgi:hypothetical protein
MAKSMGKKVQYVVLTTRNSSKVKIGAPRSTMLRPFRPPFAILSLMKEGGSGMVCYYCGVPCLSCHLWYHPPHCHLFSTYHLPLPLSSIQLPSLHPHDTTSARHPLVSCHVSLSLLVTSSYTPALHAPSSSILFKLRGIPQLMSQLLFLLHHLHSVHAFNSHHTLIHISHRGPSQ